MYKDGIEEVILIVLVLYYFSFSVEVYNKRVKDVVDKLGGFCIKVINDWYK